MRGGERGMESTTATIPWTVLAKPPRHGAAVMGGSVAATLPSRWSWAHTAPKLPSCGYCS